MYLKSYILQWAQHSIHSSFGDTTCYNSCLFFVQPLFFTVRKKTLLFKRLRSSKKNNLNNQSNNQLNYHHYIVTILRLKYFKISISGLFSCDEDIFHLLYTKKLEMFPSNVQNLLTL